MKKLYSLLMVIFLVAGDTFAQNDCSTPFLLPSGSYTYSAITGTPNPDTTNEYGCLVTQANVTWLYFRVCFPGSIDLMLTGMGTSGLDIDFIAWGPLSSLTDCGLDSSQIIDCGYTTGTTENCHITGSVAGQYYKIMVSNFSDQPGTVTISQTGGSGQACTGSGCPGPIITPQAICQVTTDPLVNHNIIIWEKDTAYHGDYILQKETTTAGSYSTIHTALNSDSSAYEDIVSDPTIQSFKYRIVTSDTCGDIFNGSPHTTIHVISSSALGTGYPQLSWNPYVGFSYGTYFIYRGASPSALALYDSIASSFTTYTDVSPSAGMPYYGVAVFPPSACQPSRAMNQYSLSNVIAFVSTGIANEQFHDLVLSPNPASDELLLSFGKPLENVTIALYDCTGRKVLERRSDSTSEILLNTSAFSNGSYFLRLQCSAGMIQRSVMIVK